MLDADLLTVTAAADKVFRIGEPEPWILHFEVQSGFGPAIEYRTLRYSVLLDGIHGLPVQSVVVLLRPEAERQPLSGRYVRRLPRGGDYQQFAFDVIRV